MRFLLLFSLAACGARPASTPEADPEEVAGDDSTEVTAQERYIAGTTRIFEACYDDLGYLDATHRERRELRVRRLREEEVSDELPAGLVVERVNAGGPRADELDASPPSTYSAHEQGLIALEAELDSWRAEHPDPEAWTDGDWAYFEGLADRFVAHCRASR